MELDKKNLDKFTISQLIEVAQSYKQEHKNLEYLLENIHGISWEFDLEKDRFSFVSANAKKFLGYEKEDLIASPVSMIDQQETAIRELVKKIKHPLIIGAGINDGEDTKKSKLAGAVGVLMATYFVTAPDPEAKLRELAQGFLK